jgi:GT2 family glycosyltransferase
MTSPAALRPVSRRRPLSVGVVVCCYTAGRLDLTLAAVESLLCQTCQPDRVLVVVDHNPVLTRRLRQELPRHVLVVSSDGAPGLSGARNTGAARCPTDVVAFLDDDAVAAPDWLEQLLAAYADEGVLAAGGRVLPLWQDRRPAWFPDELGWVVGCSYLGMPTRRGPVRNVIGAGMSLRRDALLAAGGFAPHLGRIADRGAGCEETELCLRLRTVDPRCEVLHEPAAVVHHVVPADRGTWSYLARRCVAEGRSKATVAALRGAGPGLSSERAYSLRVIPRGVLRGLSDLLRGDVSGGGRAVALMGALALTTWGFVAGTATVRWQHPAPPTTPQTAPPVAARGVPPLPLTTPS